MFLTTWESFPKLSHDVQLDYLVWINIPLIVSRKKVKNGILILKAVWKIPPLVYTTAGSRDTKYMNSEWTTSLENICDWQPFHFTPLKIWHLRGYLWNITQSSCKSDRLSWTWASAEVTGNCVTWQLPGWKHFHRGSCQPMYPNSPAMPVPALAKIATSH